MSRHRRRGQRNDLRDVILVGHSYSGIPTGQAAERIGDRLASVVFVDSDVPTDGGSFASGWWEGREALEAPIAENGGFWAPLTAADYDGEGLTGEQIARQRGQAADQRALAAGRDGHRPLADVLPAAGAGADPPRRRWGVSALSSPKTP